MCSLIDIDLATDAHDQRTRSLEHRLAARATTRRRDAATRSLAGALVPEW
ncbi:hypothetical protein [Ornithinimicrobium cryptoxanthini]|nr:hypothetical protein [Ornithinimicrobium cryptoxanthini]